MLLQSIASKLSQCGMEVFERKLSLLEEAKNYIELNQDIAIVALHYSDTDSVLPADIPEEPTHPDLTVTLHDEMGAEQVTLRDEMPAEEPIHPDLTVTLHDEMAAEEPIHPDHGQFINVHEVTDFHGGFLTIFSALRSNTRWTTQLMNI